VWENRTLPLDEPPNLWSSSLLMC